MPPLCIKIIPLTNRKTEHSVDRITVAYISAFIGYITIQLGTVYDLLLQAARTVYVDTSGMVSPSICRGEGLSNVTVISLPLNTETYLVCFVCLPLKMEGKIERVFSFPAPCITIRLTFPLVEMRD